jgi:hypothetical protein
LNEKSKFLIFRMSHCKLRTPWPIHFKHRTVIGIDSLTVCVLFGEISIFHSRVMGLYSSNCRRFFVCCAVNWEPLGQFTSNFAQLLKLIVLRSVYFLMKFRFFIQELWERKSLQILYPIILEWKIEISPKSIQTVRPSIPITLWNLKWIGQGVLKLECDMWNGQTVAHWNTIICPVLKTGV